MNNTLERHAWRVGRVAIAAAQMEAEVAVLVHVATTGAWDNSDDWLPLATNTQKLRKSFKRVLVDYPGLLEAELYLDRFDDLLDRRNKVVHASVRYSFFETVDGVTRARVNPFEAQAVHARTGYPEALRTRIRSLRSRTNCRSSAEPSEAHPAPTPTSTRSDQADPTTSGCSAELKSSGTVDDGEIRLFPVAAEGGTRVGTS